MKQNQKYYTAFLRTGILIAAIFLFLSLMKTNAYASASFFGNYYILRPGETGEVELFASIPAGDTYHYVSSDTSVFSVNSYTESGGEYRKISITGINPGKAQLSVKSDKNGIVAEIVIQVANYKEYWGVTHTTKVKNRIKKITVSGSKLIINGSPILLTQSGSKQLKNKKKRSFKLTKDTYYGYADEGIWVNTGAAAKREAKRLYRGPILHVLVEGKKVIAYFGSC